jgi:hypothetical protein
MDAPRMTVSPEELAQAESALEKLGGFAPRRHIFLCVDPEKDKCCPREVGQESWAFLKKRLGELKLGGSSGVLRNKAGCLRVCLAGRWRSSIRKACGIIPARRRCWSGSFRNT